MSLPDYGYYLTIFGSLTPPSTRWGIMLVRFSFRRDCPRWLRLSLAAVKNKQ